MPRLLVANVAALSAELVMRGDRTPNLSDLIATGSFAPLVPVFPALTVPVQASLTTGVDPSVHGMIANGILERDSCEVHFWHQPESLLEAPRFWAGRGWRVAMLFWQNSKYGAADIVVTPHPIHTETGETIPHCYSRPAGLYDELEAELGPFPLHHYWGPMAGLPSSEWIVRCTERVLDRFEPDLTLTYLPHLDYNAQRHGPSSPEVAKDLEAVDALIGRLAQAARRAGAEFVVVSEYGMSPVSGAIEINRMFRRQGWIGVRRIRGQEYLELGDCKAFAMVDHQVAHVYVRGIACEQVAEFVASLDPRVEILDSEERKRAWGVAHERAGDLVLIAPEDRWFAYPWWLEEEAAPSFARTVDIHRKPGYDPLELFFDPRSRCIAQDPALVRGSHGRPPRNVGQMGVIVSSNAVEEVAGEPLPATAVARILERRIGGGV
jgi:predicted AlkP superfamily pyrophosphatase or phosphodiesterase